MNTPTHSAGRQQAGFTLLELIVAIVLMGLVMVMLYGGLRLGLNGWESGEQRAEATNRLRSVEEFLRRQLVQSMTVYETNGDPPKRFVVFSGRAEEIEFVASMPARLTQTDLYRMRIGVSDGKLWLRWRPYLPSDATAGEERETVLLEGVSAAEWAYFGPEQDDDQKPPRWQADWTSTERRPLLVRLNLTMGNEPWPDLVVALVEGPR
ncbi:MAG: prepilin-type N-terminal cleavage/methylation domain-containing protein [Phycisphaerales bacterium]|nr:prepilin-type N-terminal cleavage/methylation domain-containing protein [Phycisphaerales bacterium]